MVIVHKTVIIDEDISWFIDGVEHYFYIARNYTLQTYQDHFPGDSVLGNHANAHGGFRFVEGETLW